MSPATRNRLLDSLEQTVAPLRQAHFTICGRRQAAWTRHGQVIPAGEVLYVIWKTRGGPASSLDEYQGGWGYAGHIPTDKESAEWYAARATERIKALYWWQQDVVFEVIVYQPAP